MTKKVFFILMLVLLIVLFGILYFIGFTNLFFGDSAFLKVFQFLDFNSSSVSFFYLFILTIFFVVMLTIMVRMASLPNEKQKDTIGSFHTSSASSGGLSPDMVKRIVDVSCETVFRENEKRFILLLEDTTLQERLDDIYYEFSQMIVDLSEVQTALELFEKVLYWGTKLSSSKRGSVMIVDREQLTIYKTTGWKETEKELIETIKVPIGTQISGMVAAEKRFLVINDLEARTDYHFPNKEHYATKALVSFPVISNDRSIVVFNFTENTRREYYSVGEQEILRVLFTLSNKMYEFLQVRKKVSRL